MALAQEIRLAARQLLKNKSWTAMALVALGLGLGANVAIFSVVGLMVWTPLPYPQAERLAWIPQSNAELGFRTASVSWRDTRDWASASTIASITAFQSRPLALSGQGEPQHLPALQVTPEFFATLGVMPAVGRGFRAEESPETEARVAVVSHALWQGMFGGEAGALGREIRLDGRNYTVVGVMPEGFHFLYQRPEVVIPLALGAQLRGRSARMLNALARLKPGVTLAQAGEEVRAISARAEKEEAAGQRGWRGRVAPLSEVLVGRGGAAAAKSMFGAVGFVLLIACANVASLLLARGTGRRRELALRASLGASRGSLIRLQLAESLLLAVVGGCVAVVSGTWSIPLLKRIAPPEMTFFELAKLDGSTLGFGLALSVATGVIFGVAPAWLQTRGDLAGKLQEASRGSTAGRHLVLKSLVVAEMALAVVLVAASNLMIRSLGRQTSTEVGFERRDLWTAQVLLARARYPEKAQVADFYRQALENLRRDGGVEAAGLVDTLPLAGNNNYERVRVEGQEARQEQFAGHVVVSPGYFQAMRIPLLAGRDFSDADRAGTQPVAVVNQTFVRRYWRKAESPVGRRLQVDEDWVTVVGLARDVRHTNVNNPPRPEVYRPHAQAGGGRMTLVARSRGGRSLAGALRGAVWQADREQPLFRLQTMEALLYARQAGPRATGQVLAAMGAIALILAAVGTYGVVAYTAAQRVREIGIRVALGATRGDVFGMVLKGGAALAVIGLAIGVPGAYGVTPLLAAVDAGVSRGDGGAYWGVAALLAAVALGACAIPAWRAMRVDPAGVLREE